MGRNVEIGPGIDPFFLRNPSRDKWILIENWDLPLGQLHANYDNHSSVEAILSGGFEKALPTLEDSSIVRIVMIDVLGFNQSVAWVGTIQIGYSPYLMNLLASESARVLKRRGHLIIAEIQTPPPKDLIIPYFQKAGLRLTEDTNNVGSYTNTVPFPNQYLLEFKK
ncbi:hypothetical protein HY030_01625 [Candidatus Gottesmanbacteria bacterium]|nr:hypothetical protein [Candidatus Gottesmanbacteria bacterium]